MERDIVGKDYSAYLDIPSVSAKRPRDALSDLQVAQLAKMAASGVPWADTALILCYTGFRVSELLNLTPYPKIKPYLRAWLSRGGETIICDGHGHAIPPEQYREHFKELMVQIGAPDATPHWCRHTFATRLHTANADALTVK